jgi:transcriptional regulator with GAF, ATPase, and Fis domain
VKVNAGAIPDELIESELFGAEPGAFTGSTRLRIGRFEAAHGGTLLLDEIGNLSAAGQMKLLRVLQSGEFERLGSSETRRVDVRVLCATNADLQQSIARGTFRQDLYFRIAVVEIASRRSASDAKTSCRSRKHF